MRWSVWWNELREIKLQDFIDETISDRKQLMENMVGVSGFEIFTMKQYKGLAEQNKE